MIEITDLVRPDCNPTTAPQACLCLTCSRQMNNPDHGISGDILGVPLVPLMRGCQQLKADDG